jgi:U3 small nucleolar ribonucleoprotein component
LDCLSNLNFTPKPPAKEASILTQNVPAIMLEDAIPISMSVGDTKSAKEVFTIRTNKMRNKEELSKEERRQERS